MTRIAAGREGRSIARLTGWILRGAEIPREPFLGLGESVRSDAVEGAFLAIDSGEVSNQGLGLTCEPSDS